MVYILLVTIILLFFLSYRIFDSNIISPSVVVCIVFMISTVFAALNVEKWNIRYNPETYLIIIFGIIAIIMTEAFVKWCATSCKRDITKHKNGLDARIIRIDRWKTYPFIIISIGITILYYKEIYRIAQIGSYYGGSIFYNYNQMMKSGQLDLEEIMNPIITQLSKIIMVSAYVYLYAFINNIVNKDKLKNNIIYLLPIAMYAFQSALSSSRNQYLSLIIACIVFSYIHRQQRLNWNGNIAYKYIKVGFLIILIALPLFYFLGEHVMGRITGKTLFEYISVYVGGSIQHLNQYIQTPPRPSSVFGEESFVNLYSTLWKSGLTEFHRTVHLEYRYLNSETHGNVYTFFRRPLQDFGIGGLFLVIVIVFGIYSYLYYFKINDRESSYKNDKIILIFGYLYYPIALSSIEEYATLIVSFGNFVTLVMLIFAFWFFTKLKINFKT